MAYTTGLTAALGGVTAAQLVHWRRQPNPLLVPELTKSGRVRYSFRDLLAVRIVANLRTEISLQKIRKAITNLKHLDDFQHLSSYRLVADNDTIVWIGDQPIDILKRPGQHMLVTMRDVLGEFIGWAGATVVPLARPKPGVSINPGVLRGYPVAENTRVPYDTVASLVADGFDADAIRGLYPSVDAIGVTGAVAFDEYVRAYGQAA
ncbi:DUF433 domain-containing protein [Phytohabitans aurantiacus]|uniref:HTH merR-type domain-containing protein n=1 Tax=Phytohabitans aurantiacus TaxID=3016789 RepID=A0ABQ5QLM5_9ACTN|nr:DUF433 domain-containing protein [Phytohabitans aurantiacus]GLH95135.1 hypothetical protein Pa4123_04070 [Phytohabitans aurantiacus]